MHYTNIPPLIDDLVMGSYITANRQQTDRRQRVYHVIYNVNQPIGGNATNYPQTAAAKLVGLPTSETTNLVGRSAQGLEQAQEEDREYIPRSGREGDFVGETTRALVRSAHITVSHDAVLSGQDALERLQRLVSLSKEQLWLLLSNASEAEGAEVYCPRTDDERLAQIIAILSERVRSDDSSSVFERQSQ